MDDLISRQAAVDAINNALLSWSYMAEWRDNKIRKAIVELPSAQPEQHLCRDCKWVKYYGNVDKNGNVESYWHCMNWDGGTDEEGYCHEWESR